MAGKADIEAGRAHIMVYLKNSALMKGLNGLKSQMQGLGSQVMGVGASLTGLGAAIVAPLAGAVLHFSKVGSELADMSARTGMAAGSLAELKFAAEQTGAGLDDIEKAVKKQQQNGSLLTFDQMAAKIAAIEDPAKRTKAALDNWGKSGTMLLPMIENLQQLRQEARDLGLVPTEEAVGMADAIGDSLDKIKSVISATVFEIGAALAPVLLPALETVKNIAGWFNRWAKENGALIRTVAMIGAGLLVAGGVITAIGAAIFGIGTAFGLLASAITGVGTVLGFLLNPVTLVIAAVAAGIFIWARFTESGRAAVQGLVDFFGPLLTTAMTTIRGIGDALMAGDLSLAGQIAITGLRLVMLQGLQAIAGLIGGVLGSAISNIGGKLIRGDLKGAWDSVVRNMAALWDGFVAGIVSAFTSAAKAVTDIWAGITKRVSATLIQLAVEAPSLGKAILGVDLHAEEARRKKMNEQSKRLGLPTNDVDVFSGANNAAKEQIDLQAATLKSSLDAVNAAAAARAEDSAAAVSAENAAGAAETSAEVQQLTAELAALRQQAAVAREAANLPKAPGAAAGLPDVAAAKASFVTFSAAALAAQGAGPQDKVVRELREQKAIQKNQLKEAEKTRQKIDALQMLATA